MPATIGDLQLALAGLRATLHALGLPTKDLVMETWSPGDRHGTRYRLTCCDGSVNVTDYVCGKGNFLASLRFASSILNDRRARKGKE